MDDISVVTGTNAAVGSNYVRNGDFESALLDDPTITNSWFFGTNYTSSLIVGDLVHEGSGALKIIGTTPGIASQPFNRLIYQFVAGLPSATSATLSFWYWATNSATNLYVRVINGSGLATGPANGPTNINIFITPSNYVPTTLIAPGTNSFSPGTNNTGVAVMTPIPPLWLNEVQADNANGILDNAGNHEPWVEIYNAGTNTLTLTNLFLSNNYTNLANWAFPTNTTIGPRQFLIVFCDGQPGQSTSNEPHASFRLASGSGSIALSRIWNGQTQALDYLNYAAGLDHSYGEFPDGQLFTRQEFYYVTPGTTNNGTLPPVVVSINEWLADNIGALPDPADGNYEDWFELYNGGSNAVSLAGYYLTDTLTNKFKFEIPSGFMIPPHGYLLVWADSESSQNALATGDLHVNFGLSKSGEAIGLFTPDGIQIDAVTFNGQISDVSMGRFADGSASIYLMTNYTPRAANYFPQPNVAPVLAPITNRTVFEGEALSFIASATDSNSPAQTLTWILEPGAPVGAIINSNTGGFGWVPSEAQGGQSYSITVRVTDNGTPALSDTKSFLVNVIKTNSAPTLAVGGGRVVGEGDTLTFVATANDADSPAQTLTFSLDASGLPAGASINPSNGVFAWQPDETQGPGVYTITIRVTDNGAPPLSGTALVTIIVNESNTPPALAAITNRTVLLGDAVSFTAQASDIDLPAQLIAFDFATAAPAGATIGATNGMFSWTANTVGTNTFTVRAMDNGPGALTDTKTFDIIVTGSSLLTTISISNQIVTLNWNAISNRSYDVEFKNDLSEADWTPLVTNIVATGDSATTTDAVGTNTQRLYRIVLQP
jgi:hypothetical protein